MSSYRVFLLGAPRIEFNLQPVAVDTRKALALLAFLILNGEPQSRDTVAAFLWPELDQSSARGALRRTLSTLRRALDKDMVDFGREVIALKPEGDLWCDVIAFQTLLNEISEHGHPLEQVCERCLSPLLQAAELYKADFMAGFSLRDSAAFDDWQFFEADRLRRELGSVLERLVSLHSDRGELQAALEVGRRWLNLDMLNESAHRALILLYAQIGQRNAALRQYRECVRILDQELGVPPLEETTQLYEAVKSNRIQEPGITRSLSIAGSPPQADTVPRSARIARPSKRAEYLLIGRMPEWEELNRTYENIDQNGVFAVITGEIGIGKTHLAQGFISHRQKLAANALSVRCFAGESSLAYTPLIDLLRQGINQAGAQNWWQGLNPRWLREISILLPEISEIVPDLPPPRSGSDPAAQNRFYESVCQVLTALVEGAAPGIIFIDDLEWVDESSLDLLAYFARRLKNRPVMLLLAWGSETSLATTDQDQLLQEAVQQGYGIQLPLPRLDQDQIVAIIDQIVPEDQQFSPAFKHKLVELSGGLPYILLEYIGAAQRGEIDSQIEVEDWPVPLGLRGLLENRLEVLSGPALQILQAAAVIGRTFSIELLRSTSGRSEEEIIQSIEELLAHNLIIEILDPTDTSLPSVRYDFTHQQMRDLLLEDLSLVRLRLLHRRTAEALEEQQRSAKQYALNGQIAHHYQGAGISEKAAQYFFQAGMQDRAMHANADALNHFQAALALGYSQKLDVLLALGDLYTLIGDYSQAIQNYEAAAAYDVPALLPAIEQKIGQVYLRRGQWEQAVSHFETATFDLSVLPIEEQKAFEARLRADLSLAFHRRGEIERAVTFAHESLSLAEAEGDLKALAQAQNLLGILARSDGQAEGALQHLEQSLSFAEQLDNPEGEIAALNNLALAQADLDEQPAALKTIRLAIEKSILLGDRHLEAALRSNYADILRAAGDSASAIEQIKEAAAIFAEIGQSAEEWEPEIWKLVEW